METVLITGTNKGVGLEMTKIYAARGDKVLACCRNPEAADDLKAVEGDVTVLTVVVGDSDSVNSLAAELEGQSIDLLINNAGMAGPAFEQQSVVAMDFDGWAETHNVNTMGPVRMMQALLPNLKAAGDGKVVTITSQMGAMSLDMTAAYAYCASKAAVNKFMKLASIELGKKGISIALVHPGWVKTDMGGPHADITAEESATGVVNVIDGLNPETNGSFWKWNGEVHDW